MSTQPAANTLNVPAHIAARIQARGGQKSSALSAIFAGDFSYPKISTKASRFRLVEDGTETVVGQTLDVVIVGASPFVAKQFYGRPYDPNDVSPPDCFSNDGKAPDPSVEKPVHDACGTCPNNVLGSKINPGGAKSKLCGDQRHLAVVCAADPTKVYGLTVPVSGMKALRDYFKDLSNYGLIPEECVTQLGFDDNASYPKLTFKRTGFVPEKAATAMDKIAKSDPVQVALRLVAPSGAPALAAPAAKPALAAVPTAAPAAPAAAPAAPVVPPAASTAPAPAAAASVAAQAPAELGDLEAKLNSLFAEP